MPELPEVETVCRGLARCLVGTRLSKVWIRCENLRRPVPADSIKKLEGQFCLEVSRRAKYLLLHLDGTRQPRLLIHLGMSGRVTVDRLKQNQSIPGWQKHEHWRMLWRRDGSPGLLLRFTDTRRFSVLDYIQGTEPFRHPLLVKLGPEPFDPAFNATALFRATRGCKVSVKCFIMDAHHVAGIGNIYASEACFRAGIRPQKSIGRLNRPQCGRLVNAIQLVLQQAIDQGGTTLRDYIGVDAKSGRFQQSLCVYGRAGLGCPSCETHIVKEVLGSRSTYFCPNCQS